MQTLTDDRREELKEAYAEALLDQTTLKDLERFYYDHTYDALCSYDDAELLIEIEHNFPHILKDGTSNH